MTIRKIIFIVILAFFGISILNGAYKWRENHIIQKDMEYNKLYTTQLEEMKKEESSAMTSQENQVKTLPANNARTPTTPTTPTTLTTPTIPGNDKNPLPNPVPPSAAKITK